ncbi:MAG: hypothetical protein LUD77_00065, partial [Clostridiales bacterium]|nr:hypothetical protein [Clostridiales bacterium]
SICYNIITAEKTHHFERRIHMEQNNLSKNKGELMSDFEKMKKLTDLTAENHMQRLSDGTVPEKGRIQPNTNYFEIPGSKYLACLRIQSYLKNENKRQICIAVLRPNSKYSMSVFDKEGTNE